MSFRTEFIPIGKLLLDLENNRNLPQGSQPAAHLAMIAEQGRKLTKLAQDIIKHELNPFDLTMVIDAGDGNGNFIVIEGNRRFCAMNLVLHPELAEGTQVHATFKKLHKESVDKIPKRILCVIAPHRKDAGIWIRRKHASDLEGAGTDAWGAMAKARADAKDDLPRPDLDAVNFVLTQPNLDPEVQKVLEGSKFSITTLDRLIRARDVQTSVGFKLQDEKLVSKYDKARLAEVFTEIVSIIAKGEHQGKDFTERDVDTEEKRVIFLKKVLKGKPKMTVSSAWEISGDPKPTKLKISSKNKTSPTTKERKTLISKAFKLQISETKINDVFDELKKINVEKYPHAISVLFRVFIEFTVDAYMSKCSLPPKTNQKGEAIEEKLVERIKKVATHLKSSGVMTEAQLKPVTTAAGDTDSLLNPNTLNAYVHSKWLHPDPMSLKRSWNNIEPFIQHIWGIVK